MSTSQAIHRATEEEPEMNSLQPIIDDPGIFTRDIAILILQHLLDDSSNLVTLNERYLSAARILEPGLATDWKFWELLLPNRILRKDFYRQGRNSQGRFYERLFEHGQGEVALKYQFPRPSSSVLCLDSLRHLYHPWELYKWSLVALENLILVLFGHSQYRSLYQLVKERYGGWERLLDPRSLQENFFEMKIARFEDSFIAFFSHLLWNAAFEGHREVVDEFVQDSGFLLPALLGYAEKGAWMSMDRLLGDRKNVMIQFPKRFGLDLMEYAARNNLMDLDDWFHKHGIEADYFQRPDIIPSTAQVLKHLSRCSSWPNNFGCYLQSIVEGQFRQEKYDEGWELLHFGHRYSLLDSHGYPQLAMQISDDKEFRVFVSFIEPRLNREGKDTMLYSLPEDRLRIALEIFGHGFYPRTLIRHYHHKEIVDVLLTHSVPEHMKEVIDLIKFSLKTNRLTRDDNLKSFLAKLEKLGFPIEQI
jgi:hypothetical protein